MPATIPQAGRGNLDTLLYPYDEYRVITTYFYDAGLKQMAVGDDSSDSVVVRKQAPLGWMLVEFSIVRRGAPPLIPSVLKDPNLTLLQAPIVVTAPSPLVPGIASVYSIAGYQLYAMKKPLPPDGDIPMGRVPLFGSKPETLPKASHITVF
jgi:hypothetical protein